MQIVRCDNEALIKVAKILMDGGVAVIPTDTVYGLAAHPSFPEAVSRLYTIKGREEKKPIALLASSVEAVEDFGAVISDKAKELSSNWPGAITLILHIPSSGYDEGFRVPNHNWTRELIKRCGGVLRVTSANLSGMRPATDAPQALADVGLSADIVVDDGVSPGGVPSAVVKITSDGEVIVLRDGPIKGLKK